MQLGSAYVGKIMEKAEATSDEEFDLWLKPRPDSWEQERIAEADGGRLPFFPVDDWPAHWRAPMNELLRRLREHMEGTTGGAVNRQEVGQMPAARRQVDT
jgi:hypothetical protein